jgi:hypothetical protein
VKKFKTSEFKSKFVTDQEDPETQIILSPVAFIVGGVKNPSAMIFDAQALNDGTADATLFKTCVASNKLNGLRTSNTVTRSPINIDEESVLSAAQQVKNKMALNVFDDLNIAFIETPSNMLLEINQDEDAGLIPSSKYLGENTLFTTESLLESSLFDKGISVTSESEIDIDISGIVTNVVDSILQSSTGARDVGLDVLGKKSK